MVIDGWLIADNGVEAEVTVDSFMVSEYSVDVFT